MTAKLDTEEALRTVYPDPGQTRGKVLPALDPPCEDLHRPLALSLHRHIAAGRARRCLAP